MTPPRTTAAIQAIIRDLDAGETLTPSYLADALRRPLTIDDIAPWIRFDPENYTRNLVARTARWELRLLCWRPGQTSSLHGHGPSACAFRIMNGSARETILGERDRTWAPGDVIAESRRDLVHQIGNLGSDALVSLHAYSPELPVDAPSPRAGRNVAIVGGGFSGIALATHLLRRGSSDLRITIIERGPWLGRGVAYGVDSEVFRLNVPAARMSLLPELPDDFVRWAGADATPGAFLPRTVYARYVVERFREALRASRAKLRIVRGEAARIDEHAVAMQDGASVPADVVVLATGLAPRIVPSTLPADPRIIDAWDECALAALPRDGRLLVLGSGLTALDVVAFLAAHDFQGTAAIVSRRGLLPRPHGAAHAPLAPLASDDVAAAPRDLRGVLRWGRGVVREAIRHGGTWQQGIDRIRPHVGALWRGLPPADRARFVRSVRPYWDVLRHRAPREADELVTRWCAESRLALIAGSIARCRPTRDGLEVDLRLAGGGTSTQHYDAIVRCIGPALDRAEADAPVIHALIESGAAAADPAGLGIVTDEQGHVVDRGGNVSTRLLALGALRRASSWETTAVPEIAIHALALAREIVP